MKHVLASNLKTCILISYEEFKGIIYNLFEQDGATLYMELSMDGIYIGYDNDELPLETIHTKLAEYFEVDEITSFHADDCDYPGIWIVYNN